MVCEIKDLILNRGERKKHSVLTLRSDTADIRIDKILRIDEMD